MKSASIATIVTIVAGVAGAVSAAVTTSVLRSSAAADREAAAGELAVTPAPESEVLAHLRALQEESRELRDRLSALELVSPPEAREPVGAFVSQEDFDALQAELRAWMEEQREVTAARTVDAASPEFEGQVAEALETIRKDETIAKVTRQQERKAAELEERVTRLSEWLALDVYQTNEMRAIVAAKDERDRELIQMWQDGVDEETLGEIKRTNRDAFGAEIERVLDPQQLETFQSKYGDGR